MVTPDPDTPPAPPTPKNFFEMVNALPHWQSSLLVHLDSEHQPDRLKQLLEGGEPLKLFLVSDGGDKGDLGSFGWELAVKGPTFGLDPGSFHAESHGMHSVLLFLDLCFNFFLVQAPATVESLFCCDNQGLIKRINFAMNGSWTNPKHCLALEYDVESGIVDILNRLPIKLACLHVKGHQDEDTPAETLPWEAQMNCHADACATDYLDNWAVSSQVVPFIPASQASISIAGVSITRNVARRLRQAASSPALANHIMSTNGWNDWIFNSIDWDSQAKALNTLEHTQ
jgi:hypothetical protein